MADVFYQANYLVVGSHAALENGYAGGGGEEGGVKGVGWSGASPSLKILATKNQPPLSFKKS